MIDNVAAIFFLNEIIFLSFTTYLLLKTCILMNKENLLQVEEFSDVLPSKLSVNFLFVQPFGRHICPPFLNRNCDDVAIFGMVLAMRN